MMMKKMLAILLMLSLCAAGAAAEEAVKISGEELAERMEQNLLLNLFDVRPAEDYDAGYIPTAGNIPLDELEDEIRAIVDGGFSRMDVEIVAYGETEEQGEMAAAILTGLGFTNVSYLEGIGVWQGQLDRPYQLLGHLDTEDIYGNKVDQSLFAGKKLIMVNVWATYCNPCIGEMSDLGKLAREMADQGVLIVGLVTDVTDGADLTPKDTQLKLARDIVKATAADYPHLLPSRDIYQRVFGQVQYVPTTFFVDAEGDLVSTQAYVGAKNYDAWKNIIETLLESAAQE